jgi:hypothetical protein
MPTNQYGASNEGRQQDANQFRYMVATHPSMERVTFRHVPPSRIVDNSSHFPESGKVRDHVANTAVQWLPLMLHKKEVIVR